MASTEHNNVAHIVWLVPALTITFIKKEGSNPNLKHRGCLHVEDIRSHLYEMFCISEPFEGQSEECSVGKLTMILSVLAKRTLLWTVCWDQDSNGDD